MRIPAVSVPRDNCGSLKKRRPLFLPPFQFRRGHLAAIGAHSIPLISSSIQGHFQRGHTFRPQERSPRSLPLHSPRINWIRHLPLPWRKPPSSRVLCSQSVVIPANAHAFFLLLQPSGIRSTASSLWSSQCPRWCPCSAWHTWGEWSGARPKLTNSWQAKLHRISDWRLQNGGNAHF